MILSKLTSIVNETRLPIPRWTETWSWRIVIGVAAVSLSTYTAVKILLIYKEKKRVDETLKHFPGPDPHWLWGNIIQIPRGRGIYKVLEWSEKYNGRFKIYQGPFLIELVFTHPEDIKCIYNTAEPKDPFGYAFIQPWLGDGLLVSKGQKWARNRRLLTPAFHFDILKPYQAVFSGCANTLVEKWKEQAGKQWATVDVFDNVSVMTLDGLMRCIFGIQSNFQKEKKKNSYIQAVYDLSDLLLARFRFFPHHNDLLYYLSRNGYHCRRALATVHGFTRSVIKQRMEEKKGGKDFQGDKKYKNFIDILIDCRDTDGQGLSSQEIQDEVDTFMFEGHDTTASGLSWCIYNMARHPHFQQKCRDEVNSVLGDRNEIQWEDLQEFPYLTMCIKESLRTHPPVPGTSRMTTKELTLCDGQKVPAGTRIGISIYSCHHNSEVWPQPEVFDPERFSPENSLNRHSHAFLPFSAGPRNCIGQHFAMNELKTCMAIILKNVEILEDGSQPPEKSPDLILRAKNPGLFLKIRPVQ